jgi:hypothetical protein
VLELRARDVTDEARDDGGRCARRVDSGQQLSCSPTVTLRIRSALAATRAVTVVGTTRCMAPAHALHKTGVPRHGSDSWQPC